MNINDLEKTLKNINFDKYFIEATFQFKLLMALGKIYHEDNIFPERSIEFFDFDPKNFRKKEIDIVIKTKENENIAIELKMPMNGQVPEQMFKFIQDIKFLEEIKATKLFSECFLLTVTNDKGFWTGYEFGGIYSYFRNNKILTGKILKPTGHNKELNYELKNEYKIEWKNLNNGFRYFILAI